MTKLWMGGTVATLVVIFVGFVYFKGGERPSRPDKPGSNKELAELSAEVAALKRNSAARLFLTGVANASEQQAAVASAAPDAPPPSTEPKAKSQQEQDEENRRLELARAESLDRKFEAEPADRTWAPLAAQEARQALQAEIAADTSVSHVDCRATWCRIETVHSDVDSFKKFAGKSLLSRERKLWNGGVAATIRDDSNGSVTAVTFITREGHDMPLPDGEESAAVDMQKAAAR